MSEYFEGGQPRRRDLMYERIPWNYKWDASEGALPNWLTETNNTNSVVSAENRKWLFEDGYLVHTTTEQNRVKFIGPMYTNGFIMELDVDIDEMTYSSWGAALRIGTGTGAHTGQFLYFMPNKPASKLSFYATTQGSAGNTTGLIGQIDKPSGLFTVRCGWDVATATYLMQCGGVRGTKESSATQAWTFFSFGAMYQTGGKLKVKAIRIYTY